MYWLRESQAKSGRKHGPCRVNRVYKLPEMEVAGYSGTNVKREISIVNSEKVFQGEVV